VSRREAKYAVVLPGAFTISPISGTSLKYQMSIAITITKAWPPSTHVRVATLKVYGEPVLTSVPFLDTFEADFVQRPEPARNDSSKKTAVREVLSWGPRSIEIEHLSSEKEVDLKKNPLAI
jgi:hypothetical protein